MEADVDLDQHVERAPGALHRLRPAARDVQVIDDERDRARDPSAPAARRVRRVNRIRQADVCRCRRRRTLRPRRASRSRCRPRRASICQRATIGDLWVLACGRSARPRASASACTRSMLRCSARAIDRGPAASGGRRAASATESLRDWHRTRSRDRLPDYAITGFSRRPTHANSPGNLAALHVVARETSAARRRRRGGASTISPNTSRKSVVTARSRPS